MPVISPQHVTIPVPGSNFKITGERVTCEAGVRIIEAHQQTEYVYEILAGLAKVYTFNDRGDQYIHLIYGPGELFPLAWINDAKLHEAYVESVQPMELVRYEKRAFMHALQTDPEAAFGITQRIVSQLTLYAARLDNLEYHYASQRLAYRLVFLAQRFGEPVKGAVRLPAFTNQDIACTINLSRESVNRGLARFSRLGLIRCKGNVIYIKNLEGLRKEVSKKGRPLYIRNLKEL